MFALSKIKQSSAKHSQVLFLEVLLAHDIRGLSGWLSGKESACQRSRSGDAASVPGSGRSPGVGNSNPLQFSCLEHSMDRGAWRATVHGVAKSQTQLSMPERMISASFEKTAACYNCCLYCPKELHGPSPF